MTARNLKNGVQTTNDKVIRRETVKQYSTWFIMWDLTKENTRLLIMPILWWWWAPWEKENLSGIIMREKLVETGAAMLSLVWGWHIKGRRRRFFRDEHLERMFNAGRQDALVLPRRWVTEHVRIGDGRGYIIFVLTPTGPVEPYPGGL